MLRSKNHFVNYSYDSFHDLRSFENVHSKQKDMPVPKCLIHIWVMYEHTLNKYPCNWFYFNSIPLVNSITLS